MEEHESLKQKGLDIEGEIYKLDSRIENLKTQYILFFSGELQTPPEKEREAIETAIRKLLYSDQKKARINLLIQNIASKFTLYNNMWLKRLHEVETGMVVIKKKPQVYMDKPRAPQKVEHNINVSLNHEESFDQFYEKYKTAIPGGEKNVSSRNQLINSLKAKLISSNLIDAQVNLTVEQGKLKIKIKK
jgi:hypothetical protein